MSPPTPCVVVVQVQWHRAGSGVTTNVVRSAVYRSGPEQREVGSGSANQQRGARRRADTLPATGTATSAVATIIGAYGARPDSSAWLKPLTPTVERGDPGIVAPTPRGKTPTSSPGSATPLATGQRVDRPAFYKSPGRPPGQVASGPAERRRDGLRPARRLATGGTKDQHRVQHRCGDARTLAASPRHRIAGGITPASAC